MSDISVSLNDVTDISVSLNDVTDISVSLDCGADVSVVNNGGFDSDTAWTKQAGWAISGGKAVATATTGNIYQDCLEAGEDYEITFTVSDYSSGSVRALILGDGGTPRTANGTYTETLSCAADTNLYIDGFSSFTGKIDNVIAYKQ